MLTLYHGTMFRSKGRPSLKPGYLRTGKATRWDTTESNRWLYATTDRDEAISQGFAGLLEYRFPVVKYQTRDKQIAVTLEKGEVPDAASLHQGRIYLFTIEYDPNDGWLKNQNAQNGLTTEYKTEQKITKAIRSVESVPVSSWLKEHTLTFSQEQDASPLAFQSPSPVFYHW